MSTYRLPLPIATHSPWWLRAWHAAARAWTPRPAEDAAAADIVADWYPLRDIPDSLQRDIGIPDALRDHARALRERDTLWLRI